MTAAKDVLPHDTLIGGADFSRTYRFPYSLNGATIEWKLACISDRDRLAVATATAAPFAAEGDAYPYCFTVSVPGASTAALSGLFVQQITVTDHTGASFKFQGNVELLKNIV